MAQLCKPEALHEVKGVGIEGLLPVIKPPSMTSHDVVDCLRQLTGIRRI